MGPHVTGTAAAIALERFEMLRGDAFDLHRHDRHQLAWASSGVLMVDVADRCWVLPPQLALWIPADVPHVTAALRESLLHGIYLDPAAWPGAWQEPTVVAVSPLARELVEHLGGELAPGARRRAEAVLIDVLEPVDRTTIALPRPRDARAREVADLLLADPADARGLAELARSVGSSARTLLRVFVAETGMTFSQWRTHARLQAATALLAEGQPVGRVALAVGYANPSAFVAVFRKATGHTPAAYFGRLAER